MLLGYCTILVRKVEVARSAVDAAVTAKGTHRADVGENTLCAVLFRSHRKMIN